MKLVNLKGRRIINSLINPNKILGQSIAVYLKEGGAFRFKVTGSGISDGKNFIDGYDDEHLNLRIDVDDIDFICGGKTL